MSASDKKKLRKEQTAELLTARQRQQQAEDKKLKTYTICFVSAMILVLVIALTVFGIRAVNQSGVIQKNTVAAVIGEDKLNSVELGYYYADAVNEVYSTWYSQYSTYTDAYLQAAMGLDPTLPLDEQYENEEEGITWADYFLEEALASAKRDYALYELAMAEGYTLPEEEQTNLDTALNNIATYASLYGYNNADKYLQASYGYGATEESYRTYAQRSAIADSFYTAHEDTLVYEDAAIREYEKDSAHKYDSFNYTSAYMSYTEFLTGGTTDEETEEVTYSDEEKQAAREALKAAAEKLATATSVEELKQFAEEIEMPEGESISVTETKDQLYTGINGTLSDWLIEEDRKDGDIAAIPNNATDTEGNETGDTNGYYVVIFHSRTDNAVPMGNVRHLLVQFEGGTEDETTGETVYSDEEIAAAKEEAEGYLKTWKEGEATEDSFIELVKEHSDDTSAAEGGLFEDIHPNSSYVENFLNWSIDSTRKAGDAEVIQTEYGFHVMYYVGTDELTYRDYMITTEMRAADQEEWYNGILEPVTAALGDTSKMKLDLIISPSY